MSWKTVKARRTSRKVEVKLSIASAGVVAADVKDPVALQIEVAALSVGHHLHGGRPGC
jgi:hypothetical protein